MATVLLDKEEVFKEVVLQRYSESCLDPKLYATCVLDFMLSTPFTETVGGVSNTIDRLRVTNDAKTNRAYAYYTTKLGYISKIVIPTRQLKELQAEIDKLRKEDIFLHDVDIDLVHFYSKTKI